MGEALKEDSFFDTQRQHSQYLLSVNAKRNEVKGVRYKEILVRSSCFACSDVLLSNLML